MPKALRERPPFRPEHRYYIDAFYDLSPSRRIGMGLGAIPCSEVVAYAALIGLDDPLDRVKLLKVVNVLDGAYLEKQQKKSSS